MFVKNKGERLFGNITVDAYNCVKSFVTNLLVLRLEGGLTKGEDSNQVRMAQVKG